MTQDQIDQRTEVRAKIVELDKQRAHLINELRELKCDHRHPDGRNAVRALNMMDASIDEDGLCEICHEWAFTARPA